MTICNLVWYFFVYARSCHFSRFWTQLLGLSHGQPSLRSFLFSGTKLLWLSCILVATIMHCAKLNCISFCKVPVMNDLVECLLFRTFALWARFLWIFIWSSSTHLTANLLPATWDDFFLNFSSYHIDFMTSLIFDRLLKLYSANL